MKKLLLLLSLLLFFFSGFSQRYTTSFMAKDTAVILPRTLPKYGKVEVASTNTIYWADSVLTSGYSVGHYITTKALKGNQTIDGNLYVNGRTKINAVKSDTIYSNISVEDSTDITDAINTYLASNDVLILPQGVFYISDTININRDNIRIIGAGKNKTILKTITDGVVRFIGSSVSNIEISKLTLRGTTVGVHTQFEIQDIGYLYFNNVVVDSCNQTLSYALKLINCYKYNIENCNFNNNNTNYALWSDDNSGTYSNISNSYFISNYLIAIRIDKRNINITNNYFWGNGSICVWLHGSAGSEFSASESNISNNTFNHCTYGIQVMYGYYDNITDNNFHDNDGYAILLRGTQNYNISNNIIKNNGNVTGDAQIKMVTKGIYNCSNNIITGNQIIKSFGISPYAITGDSAQTNNIISNNTINAHYGGGYYDIDSNNYIFENHLMGSADTNYVQNETYFMNNIHANTISSPYLTLDDDSIVFTNATAQYHRIDSMNVIHANTWLTVKMDTLIGDESTYGFKFNADSSKIICTVAGVIRVQGCVHYTFYGGTTTLAKLYTRILIDGVEARCTQTNTNKNRFASATGFQGYVGTVTAHAGSTIELQIQTDNTDLDLNADPTFDNGVAASINFEYITKK